jgi:hypothetical protein
MVPFLSAVYYTLYGDPAFDLDQLDITSSSAILLCNHLIVYRARILDSLDEVWELYTAHWLQHWTAVHVGDKGALIVYGYLQRLPKKRILI